jgi:two-component system phosphate regulon response regulator PhoB
MARVLVIEDDPELRGILEDALVEAGHEVRTAAAGLEGLRLAREQTPDLVLLDLMLPDIGGTSVCKRLKVDEAHATRVIILSAKADEIDRVVGFELGADDYVVKPFSLQELLLRVRAVLPRREAAIPAASILMFATLRIDQDGHRVWVEESEVVLTPLQFKLLVTLCSRHGRVQSRAQLLAEVCGIDSDDVETRAIDTMVKRLRQRLGSAGAYIRSVRGEGYRFSPDPED